MDRPDIRIVLVEPSHPGNIGAVARAMKNMGLEELVLVSPRQFPHSEATARASGADDILEKARVVASLSQAIDGCGFIVATTSRARDQYFRVSDVRDAAQRVLRESRRGPAAVLFGSERAGLTNEQLEAAHLLVRIPASDAYPSLNLAMAVQIVAYELHCAGELAVRGEPRWSDERAGRANREAVSGRAEGRPRPGTEQGQRGARLPRTGRGAGTAQRPAARGGPGWTRGVCEAGIAQRNDPSRGPPGRSAVPLADPAEMERLYAHLAEVLEEIDFRDRTQGGTHLMARLRRMLQRAELDCNEVNILRGILTAVQGRRRRAGGTEARTASGAADGQE